MRPSHDPSLVRAIRLLKHEGWTVFKIAGYLGCDLSTVRRAIDPKAQAAHKRWAR